MTKRNREIAEGAIRGGLTPLEYMLNIMRDEAAEDGMRFEAAKAAAPFIHPRLSSVEAKVESDHVVDITGFEWRVVDPPASAS